MHEHFNCLRDENMKKSNQFATSFLAQPLVAPVTLAILSAISTLSVAETVQSLEPVVVTATRVNQPLSEAASSIGCVGKGDRANSASDVCRNSGYDSERRYDVLNFGDV